MDAGAAAAETASGGGFAAEFWRCLTSHGDAGSMGDMEPLFTSSTIEPGEWMSGS